MRKLITGAFVLLIFAKSFSQGIAADTLKLLLENDKADSAKLAVLSKISRDMNDRLNKNDSAIIIAKTCLRLAQENHLTEWEAKSLILIGDESPIGDVSKQLYIQAIGIAHQNNFLETELTGLFDISRSYYYHPDSCLLWEKQAMQIARANDLKKWEIRLFLTAINAREGSFIKDSLQDFLARGLALCQELKDQKDSLELLLRYAVSEEAIGNYPESFQRLLELSKYYEERGDSSGITRAIYLLGRLLYNEEDYKQSIAYLHKGESFGRERDLYYIVFINTHLAGDYVALKEKDSAIYCAEKAYSRAKELYGENINGGVLNDIGLVYFELGKDSIALSLLQRSFASLIHRGEVGNICETGLGLARVFKKLGMQDSSLYYCRLTLTFARKLGFLNYISETSTLLTDHYKTKNIDSAFYYQQIGAVAYDSLYSQTKQTQFQNLRFSEQQKNLDIAAGKKTAEIQYRNDLKVYTLIVAMAVFLLVAGILYRNNFQKQKALALLQQQKLETDVQKNKVEKTLEELKSAQAQLIQSEKMASLGELTAGIAHEIQNPLNFVNNFSEVNNELVDELQQEIKAGNAAEALSISNDIKTNEQKINLHGKRADAIVKGMLQHAKSSTGKKELTDINSLADEFLRLSYQGTRAKDNSFNAILKVDYDQDIGKISIIPQDIGRVLVNLYNNGFYAIAEKKKQLGERFEPEISVSTKKINGKIEIMVRDNGNGISQKVIDKIFQPFFTTKPTGQGTGLGLSLSYDIIKAHQGEIKVDSKEGEYTLFSIYLPAVL